MAAMQLGKHVYVQKPLTRTITEARALTEAARKYKVVTQMGNQGHSEEGLRLMQEWFDAGAIGEVREVHCWTNRPIWPQGMPRPTEAQPVPDGLDWDLWLGPAPMRPFHKAYHPFSWRAWQDFGAGALGDMACHVMDASYTVLKLGAPDERHRRPVAYNVRAAGPGTTRLRAAACSTTTASRRRRSIHLTFPQRGNMPPVKLHWYDGGLLPERPEDLEPERRLPESGTIFVGEKGKMWCETYSESPRLIPETAMQAFKRPAEDAAARAGRARPGHEKNWLDAIRQQGPGGVALRLRRPVHRDGAARQRRAAVPGRAPVVGRGGHEGHQHARGQPVRAAHYRRAGRLVDGARSAARSQPGMSPRVPASSVGMSSMLHASRSRTRRRDRARGQPRARVCGVSRTRP